MLLARTPDLDLYYAACFDGKRAYSATRRGTMVGYDVSATGTFAAAGTMDTTTDFLYCATQDDLLVQGAPHYVTTIDISGATPVKQNEFDHDGPYVAPAPDTPRDPRPVGEHAQITILGNVLYVGDDHGVASAFVPHSAAPDTTPPTVVAVSPADGATGQAATTRVGIGFSDAVRFESVDPGSLRLLDAQGTVLAGTYSVQLGVVNFAPAVPLRPGATYTVLLPAGGVQDIAGNALAAEFRSTFATAGRTGQRGGRRLGRRRRDAGGSLHGRRGVDVRGDRSGRRDLPVGLRRRYGADRRRAGAGRSSTPTRRPDTTPWS